MDGRNLLDFTGRQVLDSDGSGGLSSVEFQAAMKKLVLSDCCHFYQHRISSVVMMH